MSVREDPSFKRGFKPPPFIVTQGTKGIFVWSSFILLGALLAFSVHKRITYYELMVTHILEPTPMGNPVAPSLELQLGTSGQTRQLSDYKGQWVLINFWATWCAPCRDEMPSMEMLNRKLGSKIKMMAITVDQDWGEVNRFFGQDRPSFELLWDKDKSVSKKYGVFKFPESFLISPNGVVVAKFIGPRDWYTKASVAYFEEVIAGKRRATGL